MKIEVAKKFLQNWATGSNVSLPTLIQTVATLGGEWDRFNDFVEKCVDCYLERIPAKVEVAADCFKYDAVVVKKALIIIPRDDFTGLKRIELLKTPCGTPQQFNYITGECTPRDRVSSGGYRDGCITLYPSLFFTNSEIAEELPRTLYHEIGHLVSEKLFPQEYRRSCVLLDRFMEGKQHVVSPEQKRLFAFFENFAQEYTNRHLRNLWQIYEEECKISEKREAREAKEREINNQARMDKRRGGVN